MDAIRTYILSVGAAGLLCAITGQLAGKDGMTGRTLQLVSGLFMLLTIVQPFGTIRIRDIGQYIQQYQYSAQDAVTQGENLSALALGNSIKEAIASYILDKGADHGLKLTVQVQLDEAFPPNLLSVDLSGDASAYARQALTATLCRDLGLEKEDILWQ